MNKVNLNRQIYLIRIVTLVFLLGLLSGCLPSSAARGKINMATRKVVINKNITQLSNISPFSVTYVIGQPGVKIRATEDMIDKVIVREKGNKLEISYKEPSGIKGQHNLLSSEKKSVNITVSLPEITSIENYGSGDITASRVSSNIFSVKTMGSADTSIGSLEATSVKIATSGSGDVKISFLNATTVQTLCQGSGDIDMSNIKVVRFNATVQGAGDLDVGMIDCSQIEVLCQGSGDVVMNNIRTISINALAQGAGDITLAGESESTTLLVQGAGDIDARKLRSRNIKTNRQGVGTLKY